MTNEKEKIKDIVIPVLPNNKTDERKLEIEIKIIKKSCFNRYKRKISFCCNRLKSFFKECCKAIFLVLLSIIVFGLAYAAFLLVTGLWFVIYIIIK